MPHLHVSHDAEYLTERRDGLHEARLGLRFQERGVHTSHGVQRKEFGQILKYSDAIIFNSFYQLENTERWLRNAEQK